MLRKDLLGKIQEQATEQGLTVSKKDLGVLFNVILETIGESVLSTGESVTTPLGTFKVRHSNEREGFNPLKREEKITIKARDTVTLKAAPKFVKIAS